MKATVGNQAVNQTKYRDLNDNIVDCTVKQTLSFTEVCTFIETVKAAAFGNRRYNHYMEEIAFIDCLLRFYTDIKIKDLDTLYALHRKNDFKVVIGHLVDQDQLDFIHVEVAHLIAQETQTSHFDNLCKSVSNAAINLTQISQALAKSGDFSKIVDLVKTATTGLE